MLVIKCQKLVSSYDYFTRNGKGSFNPRLYAEILAAKGINPEDIMDLRWYSLPFKRFSNFTWCR
jgi:hypothetical protein